MKRAVAVAMALFYQCVLFHVKQGCESAVMIPLVVTGCLGF